MIDDVGNLKEWIENGADGEPIEAVVIGTAAPRFTGYKDAPLGVPLSWEDALRWIDRNFHSGFGSAGCPPVYAWTATRVFFVIEYDGSTSIGEVPRNPVACDPDMAGG